MLAALLLLAAQPAPPTLEEVERLRPSEAGDMILKGHGPIVSVVRRPRLAMAPPGMVELDLIEAAVDVPGGCTRRRWSATFFGGPGKSAGQAVFDSAYENVEVALPEPGGCSAARFVHVNPGLDPGRALKLLAMFRRVAAGSRTVSFTCRSVRRDGLCRSAAAIRTALSRTLPSVIGAEGKAVEFWLPEGDGTVTTVRFRGNSPRRVDVHRDYPDPF